VNHFDSSLQGTVICRFVERDHQSIVCSNRRRAYIPATEFDAGELFTRCREFFDDIVAYPNYALL
jgi:hypothetical protein